MTARETRNPFFSLTTTNFMENIPKTVPENPSDETLIRQFKEGRKEAFDTLYRRYLPSVYKRVRYVAPESDIEDITQEVFIAALKSLPSFRGDSQFGTWLRTLTNHKVAEFYRKRNRKQEPPLAPLSEASGRMEDNDSKSLEERVLIQRALQKLPQNYREVILLRFAEDLQFNEIADQMDQNLEATKSLFRRAISALRNHLDG
ncbi:MAG: sigma-70 family RNA polymerase sigma factor [Anaerolineaceae bacterium]|jgi:RNA polymerase sigma-70 factor (ECF subfamily)|nr:MAG: sigma-70 family RNA polymerase sigma factor [Anaerolineaceae bacterium]